MRRKSHSFRSSASVSVFKAKQYLGSLLSSGYLQHYKEAACHQLAMEKLLHEAGVDMVFTGIPCQVMTLATLDNLCKEGLTF